MRIFRAKPAERVFLYNRFTNCDTDVIVCEPLLLGLLVTDSRIQQVWQLVGASRLFLSCGTQL